MMVGRGGGERTLQVKERYGFFQSRIYVALFACWSLSWTVWGARTHRPTILLICLLQWPFFALTAYTTIRSRRRTRAYWQTMRDYAAYWHYIDSLLRYRAGRL